MSEVGFKRSIRDKLVAVVGTGISGKAELFRSRKLNKLYVVKTYHGQESYESKKEYRVRVLCEYHIILSLHHVNIISVLGYSTGLHSVKIVMEAGSPNLSVLVKTCKPTPTELMCCWRQICDAIFYIHSLGICHRDLKLLNVVFDTEYHHIKLIDWCTASQNEECVGIVGSEPLATPEQFASIRYRGLPVDIWSLGILLLQLYSGRYPWKCAIISNKDYTDYVGSRDDMTLQLPMEMRELVLRMLEPIPQKRVTIQDICSSSWFKSTEHCGASGHCKYDHSKTFATAAY